MKFLFMVLMAGQFFLSSFVLYNWNQPYLDKTLSTLLLLSFIGFCVISWFGNLHHCVNDTKCKTLVLCAFLNLLLFSQTGAFNPIIGDINMVFESGIANTFLEGMHTLNVGLPILSYMLALFIIFDGDKLN